MHTGIPGLAACADPPPRMDAATRRRSIAVHCSRHAECDRGGTTEATIAPFHGYRTTAAADDDLFERINTNSRHVLYQFLPPKTAHSYNTRPRHHNFSLIEQSTDLNQRFLYACYINLPTGHSFFLIYSLHYCVYHFYVLLSRACQLLINQYLMCLICGNCIMDKSKHVRKSR